MRILGFSEKWPKLNKQRFSPSLLTFTTFRFPRRDKDWEVEEIVQVVYKPRSKDREPLGIARIIRKDTKDTRKKFYGFGDICKDPDVITPAEAYEDGFSGMHGGGDINKLMDWLYKPKDRSYFNDVIVNKLTLYWISRA